MPDCPFGLLARGSPGTRVLRITAHRALPFFPFLHAYSASIRGIRFPLSSATGEPFQNFQLPCVLFLPRSFRRAKFLLRFDSSSTLFLSLSFPFLRPSFPFLPQFLPHLCRLFSPPFHAVFLSFFLSFFYFLQFLSLSLSLSLKIAVLSKL